MWVLENVLGRKGDRCYINHFIHGLQLVYYKNEASIINWQYPSACERPYIACYLWKVTIYSCSAILFRYSNRDEQQTRPLSIFKKKKVCLVQPA